MLVSEDWEIQVDKQNSPHQFSADYGPVQDTALNSYLERTGKKIATLSHRPHMPYSFRGVNATYVNAYAFPGGSIAATRGILLTLSNEAELGGLLGHELGHVNARHTAEQMSKNMVATAVIGGITGYVGGKGAIYGDVASKLGMIGAGMLLAGYSRDNEREADALGMKYMVRAGYSPKGLVGLMDVLRSMSRHRPSAIELMFATHPMSEERYQTAVEKAEREYRSAQKLPLHRDRYMDHTAKLRSIKSAIEGMQKGETAMAKQQYGDAEKYFRKALKEAPEDYAGLVMMSKCQLVQKRYGEAQRYAERAKELYAKEPQAYHLSGIAKIQTKNFDGAYEEFSSYERLLPGNPTTLFLKGLSLEGMERIKESATEYYRYLEVVREGKQAQYAYQRLVEWGYIKRAR
jgi:predicted Zn-dependent protease